MPGGCIVRDANGQALVYVYSRENEAEAMQAKVLTVDEARRIAIKRREAAGVAGEGRSQLNRIAGDAGVFLPHACGLGSIR
jgi:hypothetical protein